MKRTAFIWDLDGTLFDSYRVIVPNASQILRERGIAIAEEEIYRFTIQNSLSELFQKAASEYDGDGAEFLRSYWELQKQRDDRIPPMEHAMEILEEGNRRGVLQFVYTHKGRTAHQVLERMGMKHYFREIITGEDGFARKPSPEAVDYLVIKYGLDRKNTWFIGDRKLDMACAENAGINSIFFMPTDLAIPTGRETCVVKDLLVILNII